MNTILQQLQERTLHYGEAALCRLGQQSFLVKLGDAVFGIDLYLSPETRRLLPPVLSARDAAGLCALWVTHDHRDHLDRPQLPVLAQASPEAILVVPEAVRPSVTEFPAARVRGINAPERLDFSGVTAWAIPAAHEELSMDERGNYHALGYVFSGNGFTFFHAGDGCPYPGLDAALAPFPLDAVLLPINGRDAERRARGCLGCMDYREAGDLAGKLQVKYAVPGHYDMFAGNTENPKRFVQYVTSRYPRTEPVELPPGEIRIFRSRNSN